MRTAKEITQSIRSRILVTEPALRLDPVTPERKIVDSVAEEIADAQIDQYVQQYQYDIDTKAGRDLDRFVATFGHGRISGRRASGTVTFSRATPSIDNIVIPAGTQVFKRQTLISQPVTFVTVNTVVLAAGSTEVEAPIEAIDIGPLGNVPANTITALGVFSTGDISEVNNDTATSGGESEESDAALRIRFKNTIFRNIAGTPDQYLALSLALKFTDKANILGPQSRFIEYLQVEADGTISSQIPYSKYTYPFDYYLTNGDQNAESYYAPRGVDYTFTATAPPTITVNNATSLPTDTVVLLEHSYCSSSSRNDPLNNIGNYIDLYISGVDPGIAYESVKFPTSTTNFSSTSSSPYYTGKFRRIETRTPPAVDNRFQELLWQPVIFGPSGIVVQGLTYLEGRDYWFVEDTTLYKGSKRARNGIEWASAAATQIGNLTEFVVTYTFNKLPIILDELIDRHRQVTADVLTHAANNRYFIVNLIVMYDRGASKATVDERISIALTDFLEKLQFGAVVQVSDLLETAHSVVGVDNVRLAMPGDNVPYGIQEVTQDGITPVGYPFTVDFALADSDLPILQMIRTTQRSQNTWS